VFKRTHSYSSSRQSVGSLLSWQDLSSQVDSAWDPGVVGRILRQATTKLNTLNKFDSFKFALCEPFLVRSDWSMWPRLQWRNTRMPLTIQNITRCARDPHVTRFRRNSGRTCWLCLGFRCGGVSSLVSRLDNIQQLLETSLNVSSFSTFWTKSSVIVTSFCLESIAVHVVLNIHFVSLMPYFK
jgi:hypothetical protein